MNSPHSFKPNFRQLLLLSWLIALLAVISYLLLRGSSATGSKRPSALHFTIPILSPFTSVVSGPSSYLHAGVHSVQVEHETSAINSRTVAIVAVVAAALAYGCFRYWLRSPKRWYLRRYHHLIEPSHRFCPIWLSLILLSVSFSRTWLLLYTIETLHQNIRTHPCVILIWWRWAQRLNFLYWGKYNFLRMLITWIIIIGYSSFLESFKTSTCASAKIVDTATNPGYCSQTTRIYKSIISNGIRIGPKYFDSWPKLAAIALQLTNSNEDGAWRSVLNWTSNKSNPSQHRAIWRIWNLVWPRQYYMQSRIGEDVQRVVLTSVWVRDLNGSTN